MSRRVFLHVGLPKSGTSYLQRLLLRNRSALAQDGLLIPGRHWTDQVAAVRELRDLGANRRTAEAWERIREEIREWDGDAVFSMEWLCAASPEEIDRMLADLAPAEVQVVFTVRDLARTLPAAWQEFMQNRHDWPWPEFLEGVTAEDPYSTPAGTAFWKQQDLPRLLERWGKAVPAERIHVVTVPHPGAPAEVLWQRTASVLGVAPEGRVLTGLGGNESLGLESAELIRRLNPYTREAGFSRNRYQQVFKHRLAKRHLASRKASESRLVLPPANHEWACATAAAHQAAVRASGVHVVGDLADLEPLPSGAGSADGVVPDDRLLEVALSAAVALGTELDASQRTVEQLERRVARLERVLARRDRRNRAFEAAPVRTALRMRWRRLRGKRR